MTSPTLDRRSGLVGNTPFKAPVDCATTTAIVLSGEQTIDGVLTSSSRVLVMGQADSKTNGIYDTSTAAWTRSLDSDGNYDLTTGTLVYVIGGNSFGGLVYTCTSAKPITFGTSAITFKLTGNTGALGMQTVFTVNTFAAARTLTKTGPATVSVLGHDTIHDGGQGIFVRIDSDTVSGDNNGTIIVTGDGARYYRLYVGDLYAKWFNAKYDANTVTGTGTNDAAAHQAMVNAVTNPLQQTCRGHSGNTLIDATVTLPAGVQLLFDGRQRTTCVYSGGITGSGTEYSMFKLNNGSHVSGCQPHYPLQNVAGTPKAYPATFMHAPGGCSDWKITDIRLSNVYIGWQMGDPTTGLVGIGKGVVDLIDGFPLYKGCILDGGNDVINTTRCEFNPNIFGSRYANSLLGWVAQNAISYDVYAVDGAKFDHTLTYGYLTSLALSANVLGKTPQFTSVTEPTWELCGVAVNAVNFQNQFDVSGGTITGQCGEANINGVVGSAAGMSIGSGDTTYYVHASFRGTTFRNFPGAVLTAKTNTQILDCKGHDFNKVGGATLGIYMIGANNVDLQVMGGLIDYTSRAASRGVSNQNAFTGTTVSVGGGLKHMNFAGDYTVFQPSKSLTLGQITNSGSMFYNGIVITLNNQGEMCTSAVPAAGTWVQGDRFELSGVAAASSSRIKCTTGGTSGTWKVDGTTAA